MDQHVVPQRPGDGAGEQEVFSGVRAQAVGPAGLPLVIFFYNLTLESLLRRFREGTVNPALRGVLCAGCA